MGDLFTKQNGEYKPVNQSYYKHDGIWKEATPWKKIDGIWIQFPFFMSFIYTVSDDRTVKKLDNQLSEEWVFDDLILPRDLNAIKVSPEKDVFFVDDSAMMYRLDMNGDLVWSIEEQNISRRYVAISRNLYSATHRGAGDIRIFTPNGEYFSYVSLGEQITKFDFDGNDNVYIGTNSNNLHKYDIDLSEIWVFTANTNNVTAVATEPGGVSYSGASNGRIYKIDVDGNQLFLNNDDTLPCNDLVLDQNGFLYAVSFFNLVKKIDTSDMSEVWRYSSENSLSSIAVDRSGDVYVGDLEGNLIKLDVNGNEVYKQQIHTGELEGIDVSPGRYGAFSDFW